MLDQEDRFTDPANFTIGKGIAWYWEFAQTPPEKTRGSLTSQIEACKQMYKHGPRAGAQNSGMRTGSPEKVHSV